MNETPIEEDATIVRIIALVCSAIRTIGQPAAHAAAHAAADERVIASARAFESYILGEGA